MGFCFASSLDDVALPFELELGVLLPVEVLVEQLTHLTVPEYTCPRLCLSQGVFCCTNVH